MSPRATLVPALTAAVLLLAAPAAQAQWTASKPGSDNMEILGHIPLGPRLSVADLDMEQELDRPYAYVARMVYGDTGPKGLDIISIADPEHPEILYEWRIENQDLHMRTRRHGREALQGRRPLLRGAVPAVRAGRARHGPGRGRL